MPTDALQKAAIVISSLDEDAADRLLEGMPEELASQIRMLSLDVDDIPAEERQAVLDEFLQNSGRKVAKPPVLADELELSDSIHFEQTYQSTPPPKPPDPPPFAFLNTAPSEMLGPFFEQEHPQVTAVVLSYLEPARAAEILRQLTPKLQADVIDRITELGEPDQRIVLEISQRIQQLVSEKTQTFARRRMGLTAAQAILQASTSDQAAELLGELKRRGSWVSQQLEQLQAAQPEPVAEPEPVARVAEEVSPSEPKANEPAPDPPAEKPPAPPQAEATPVEVEPRISFEALASLDDQSLAQVLQQAGPRVVLIALAGASPKVMKRIAQGLGSREQKGLQQKIRGLQPLLLSDIEQAQWMMRRIVEEIKTQPQATGGRLQVAA
ncbi:MAG: FliG C-terminal domain-containing protein [Pirellulaceae bacterium]